MLLLHNFPDQKNEDEVVIALHVGILLESLWSHLAVAWQSL